MPTRSHNPDILRAIARLTSLSLTPSADTAPPSMPPWPASISSVWQLYGPKTPTLLPEKAKNTIEANKTTVATAIAGFTRLLILTVINIKSPH